MQDVQILAGVHLHLRLPAQVHQVPTRTVWRRRADRCVVFRWSHSRASTRVLSWLVWRMVAVCLDAVNHMPLGTRRPTSANSALGGNIFPPPWKPSIGRNLSPRAPRVPAAILVHGGELGVTLSHPETLHFRALRLYSNTILLSDVVASTCRSLETPMDATCTHWRRFVHT